MVIFNLFPEAIEVSLKKLEEQLRQAEGKEAVEAKKAQGKKPRPNNSPFFSHPAKRSASLGSSLSTNPYGFLQQARSHTTQKNPKTKSHKQKRGVVTHSQITKRHADRKPNINAKDIYLSPAGQFTINNSTQA